MEGDIKVVPINRKVPLNLITFEAKSYFVKGPVHNFHLKISALYQVNNLKKQALFQIVVFFYKSPQFGMTLFGGKLRKNKRKSKVTTVAPCQT